MERICIFCGSNTGRLPEYQAAAVQVGALLAKRDITVVYGGGNVGLMHAIAESVLSHGGRVIGVIPQFLADREVVHRGVTELHIVDSMHTRKAKMAELAEGFMALPGGFGTLEELSEILTWAQLGLHHKPVGLLNVSGVFDDLLRFFDRLVGDGLLRPEHRLMVQSHHEPAELLEQMLAYTPPSVAKWIDKAGLEKT